MINESNSSPVPSTPEQSLLGKAVTYRSEYAPELLYPLPRLSKRDELGIDSARLPFVGHDLWNAYEISWLNARGKPVVALGQFYFDAATPCLIESKSLKLYLNSFNQTRFASVDEVAQTIERDLSRAAGGAVRVVLQCLSAQPVRQFSYPDGICLDELDIEVDRYQLEPALLVADRGREVVNELLYSHLLKSNCLVTGQPDWGSVMIRYSGPAIDQEGLLRYLISFRQHNEFHEQCVERIYCDIMQHCAPHALMVWARYTRRGGLDINPLRASCKADWPVDAFEVRQ